MVKVINATPAPEVTKRIICRNCGATLEYVPGDIKGYQGKDYSGGEDGCEWVDCPNCNGRAIVRSW